MATPATVPDAAQLIEAQLAREAAGLDPAAAAAARRRRWLWVAAAAAALVAIVVGIVLYERSRKKRPPTGFGYRQIVFGPCDSTGLCGDFVRRGDDAGSGTGSRNIAYYEAAAPVATGRLGAYVECTGGCPAGYSDFLSSAATSVVVNTAVTGPGAPVHPEGFEGGHCVSCADRPFSVWSPVCTAGYVAVGDVIHPGCDKPLVQDYYCVPQSCVVNGTAGPKLWDSEGGCYEGPRIALYAVKPSATTPAGDAIDGNFFKVAVGPDAGTPPVLGVYALRSTCTFEPPTPPPATAGIPGGRYRIRWAQSGLYLGTYTLFGSLGVSLVPKANAAVWTFTAPASGAGGGRFVLADGRGAMGTTTDPTPPRGIYILPVPTRADPAVDAWVPVPGAGAAGSPEAAGTLYNTHAKGYVQALPDGAGTSGLVDIVDFQNDTTRGWYFEPA